MLALSLSPHLTYHVVEAIENLKSGNFLFNSNCTPLTSNMPLTTLYPSKVVRCPFLGHILMGQYNIGLLH